MQNVKISIHNRDLAAKKESIKNWAISEEDKKSLLKFCEDLDLGKVNKGKRISEARQVKYLEILKIPLEYFNKPSNKLTLQDIESFQKDLSSGKLKTKKLKLNSDNKKAHLPYSLSTRVDISRLLKIYLKWKLGDTEKFRKMTEWFDLRVPNKTPDYLSEQEIKELFKNCKNPKERFLIAVLFDSGARAEEFHNIRFEDIQMPKDKENFVKITFKEEYSKTLGRTISLFWTYSLDAIKEFLNERIKNGIRNNEPVFDNTYKNARQILARLGKKVLNKSIHYHLFRHSSATYYANKLNRHELCYRYGWKYSSDMPDIYISRSGMENKQLDEKFTNTELEDLRKDLAREKQEKGLEIEKLKDKLKKVDLVENELKEIKNLIALQKNKVK